MSEPTPRLRLLVGSITAIYWLGLFVVTHLPPNRLPRTRLSDRGAHFAVYAILAALLLWSLRQFPLAPRRAAWLVILICFIYGVIDELLQIPVGRICSLDDWLSDAAGTSAVVAVAMVFGALRDARRA